MYMTNLTMEFLQHSFQSEYQCELLAHKIRDQLNAEVNVEGVNDGIESQNQVNAENQGDNGGLELEEDIIVPSNDEEAMNLNYNEGACGLEINFPMLNVQNIFEEMDVSGSENRLQKLIHEEARLFPSTNSSDGVLPENEPQPMDLGYSQ